MKILLFLIVALFSAAPLFAQTNAVQITGGKIFVRRDFQSPNEPTELISSVFSSVGAITHVSLSHWAVLCADPVCQPGRTFNSVGGGNIIFSMRDVHPRGDFTINGTTHENVYYSGGFQLDQKTFLIPQTARKKGQMFFQSSFKLTGRLLVCKIDDFASGCPANQLIYEGDITGHGTMIIRMRIKFNEIFGQMRTYLQPDSFEYRFEP